MSIQTTTFLTREDAIKKAKDEFLAKKHNFKTLVLESDAHIACLAYHNGKDGAILNPLVNYDVETKFTEESVFRSNVIKSICSKVKNNIDRKSVV
jgi:hypothetical protein